MSSRTRLVNNYCNTSRSKNLSSVLAKVNAFHALSTMLQPNYRSRRSRISVPFRFTDVYCNCNHYPRISCKMGFTIEDKAFLLDCFRNGVKQGNGDWSYFIPPCIEEFQARYPNPMY
jgi:hypothetical protein